MRKFLLNFAFLAPVLALLCPRALASEFAPASDFAPISRFEWRQISQLSPARAEQISGLKISQTPTLEAINSAVHNLFNTGYFADVRARQLADGTMSFSFKSKPFIAKIELSGVGSNDKPTVLGFLGLQKGTAVDEEKIRRAKQNIVKFYEMRGYYNTRVSVQRQAQENGSEVLEIQVNRGEQIVIKRMNLVGAKALSYSQIVAGAANKERDFLGWMWGFDDGKLRLQELANDPARMQEAYRERGYLDANVSAPFLQANMQTHTAQLNYYINEGERYRVKEISIAQPLAQPGENVAKLSEKDLKSAPGAWASSAKIRKDIKKIETAYQDDGYAMVKVHPQVDKSGDGEISIRYEITPGEIYHIAQVIIDGNDKSSDRIIRRELLLSEGMRYSYTDLTESIYALRRTGYFADASIIPEPSFMPGKLNLRVKITEQSTGSISGGLGYSSADGLLINASVADRNLLGTGLRASVNFEKSKKDLTGRISLTNPRLFDTRYSLGGSVYSYAHDWDDYEELNRGVQLTLGRKFWRNFDAGLSHTYERSNLRKATVKMFLSGERLGERTKSAASPYLIYDSTDDFYLPRKGVYARLAYTYAGIGGDVKYQKLSSEFKYFYGLEELIDWDLIFRVKASANRLFNYAATPLNNRLYLGGLGSVRGYDSSSISPKGRSYYLTGLSVGLKKITAEEYEKFLAEHADDSAISQLFERSGVYEYKRGGAISANATAELSFPISDKLKLRGSFFYDFGAIGEKNLGEITRASYGVSFDWMTPMGPLVFVFSRPVGDKPGDETTKFEFSVGGNF